MTQQQTHAGNVQIVQVQPSLQSSTTTAIVPTVATGVTTTAGSSGVPVHLAAPSGTPTVYQKREGEIEAVTFVDSNSGTVYVWPVHLVQ